MEIGFHPLAFLVERVDLVAAAVLLDPADLPAFFLQHGGELFLRLPGLASAGVAGRETGRLRLRQGQSEAGREQHDGHVSVEVHVQV